VDKKRFFGTGLTLWMVSTMILSASFIAAALIFSNAIANRPMTGSFSGSFSPGSYEYPEVMSLDTLKSFLGIYPSENEWEEQQDMQTGDQPVSIAYFDDYDAAERRLRDALAEDILSGKWPDFPYVRLGGNLYFSRQAVEQWFREQSGKQLSIQ